MFWFGLVLIWLGLFVCLFVCLLVCWFVGLFVCFWFGLVSFGLFGFVRFWFGLVWFCLGLVWSSLVWFCFVWFWFGFDLVCLLVCLFFFQPANLDSPMPLPERAAVAMQRLLRANVPSKCSHTSTLRRFAHSTYHGWNTPRLPNGLHSKFLCLPARSTSCPGLLHSIPNSPKVSKCSRFSVAFRKDFDYRLPHMQMLKFSTFFCHRSGVPHLHIEIVGFCGDPAHGAGVVQKPYSYFALGSPTLHPDVARLQDSQTMA